jgi:hypothetical protein
MRAIPFLTLLLVVILSCNKDSIPDFNDDPAVENVYGTWRLVSRENYTTNQVFYKPSSVQSYCTTTRPCDVIFTLSKGTSKDILDGHTIVNSVSGAFTFDPVTKKFNVSSFGGTKIGEPDWSDNVWDNMYSIETYKVNSTQLRLYFGNESLTFERM